MKLLVTFYGRQIEGDFYTSNDNFWQKKKLLKTGI